MILWRNIENYPFLSFDSDPRFPPFLLYVRWKSGVTFVRRCFRDVKASFHWIGLAIRTLRKFVVVWLGTGGISRNMHVLLHIKAILENFIRKRFVGKFDFM